MSSWCSMRSKVLRSATRAYGPRQTAGRGIVTKLGAEFEQQLNARLDRTRGILDRLENESRAVESLLRTRSRSESRGFPIRRWNPFWEDWRRPEPAGRFASGKRGERLRASGCHKQLPRQSLEQMLGQQDRSPPSLNRASERAACGRVAQGGQRKSGCQKCFGNAQAGERAAYGKASQDCKATAFSP